MIKLKLIIFFLLSYLFISKKPIKKSFKKCPQKTFIELNYFSSLSYKCNRYYQPIFFVDAPKSEIEEYENSIKNKFNMKFYNYTDAEKNPTKITKEIVYRNMTFSEFYHIDDLRYLYQKEVDQLFFKKLNYFKNLPYDSTQEKEQYYPNAVENIYYSYERSFRFDKTSDEIPEVCGGSIDVAWTYVNSTDTVWQAIFNTTSKKGSAGRFRDYGTLKYSMRGIYKYAKFAKRWFVIISNPSQIPTFLNVSYDFDTDSYKLNYQFDDHEKKVEIFFITHNQIFPNYTSLPNFSSDSIESAFAFIPNISECFIYLNDDFFIGNKITPSFFINKNGSLNLYKTFRMAPFIEGNNWDKSVYHTNSLLKEFGDKRRLYPMHACYFWRKSILLELNKKYKVPISGNRNRQFRDSKNVVIPFLHSNYAMEMGYGKEVFPKSSWFKYYGLGNKDNNSVEKIRKSIMNVRRNIKCFCINDDLEDGDEDIIRDFKNMMENIFPFKMPFEI